MGESPSWSGSVTGRVGVPINIYRDIFERRTFSSRSVCETVVGIRVLILLYSSTLVTLSLSKKLV